MGWGLIRIANHTATAPTLTLNADKETVNWFPIGAETSYLIAVANAPSGGNVGDITQVKTGTGVVKQAFKPTVGETFGGVSELLVGDGGFYSEQDQTTVGREEAFQFTAKSSGTINEFQFATNGIANPGVTSLTLGIMADNAGLPGAVLGQGTLLGTEGIEKVMAKNQLFFLAGGTGGFKQEVWRAVGAAPLADTEAALFVTRKSEPEAANKTANEYVPNGTEITEFKEGKVTPTETIVQWNPKAAFVTGNTHLANPTTDEIIQWAAHKWGIPEDWLRAQYKSESTWRQSQAGDTENLAGKTVPAGFPNAGKTWYEVEPAVAKAGLSGEEVHASLGITQVKWRPNGSVGAGSEPLRWKSTAFNIDYQCAQLRYYFDGLATWVGGEYKAGEELNSIARWFNPTWGTGGPEGKGLTTGVGSATEYIEGVKGHFIAKDWPSSTTAGFSVPIVGGKPYWLTLLPLGTAGKQIHYNVAVTSGGTANVESKATGLTKIEPETEWEVFNQGPVRFYAVGVSSFTPVAGETVYIEVSADNGAHWSNQVAVTFPGTQVPVVESVSPKNGPTVGATSVTIKGKNFGGASNVKFGTTNATTFTVNNSTEITATSPAGAAGQVDVTVTNGGGTSATGTADHYTYETSATPSITSLSPSSGPATGGTTVTVAGINFTGATKVEFGGVAATSFTVSNDTTILAKSPSKPTGAVDVRVTTPLGISPIVSGDKYTYTGTTQVVLPGAQVIPLGTPQEDWKRAAEAGCKVGRADSSNQSLENATKWASTVGMKVCYLIKTTASLTSLITTYNSLGTAQKNALLCVEFGNENWPNGAGTVIPGKEYAEKFIATAKLQRENNFNIPLLMQVRLSMDIGTKWMDELATISHSELTKALEPEPEGKTGFLPSGNWLASHPYYNKPMLAQKEPNNLGGPAASERENAYKDTSGNQWGYQRWMKEQQYIKNITGLTVPCAVTEQGAAAATGVPDGVGSWAAVAEIAKQLWEHAKLLQEGKVVSGPTGLTPVCPFIIWYDEYSHRNSVTTSDPAETFGFYTYAEEGHPIEKNENASYWKIFKEGAEALAPVPPAHVAIIVEENRSFTEAEGVTYLKKLATEWALATNSFGVSHPSEPNYFAMISGSTQGRDGSDSCSAIAGANTGNIASQLTTAGVNWKAYMESMPSVGYTGCESGQYAKKHNPFAFFTTAEQTRVVPSSQFATDLAAGTLPDFIWYTPNLINDGHDGTNENVSKSLEEIIKPLLASKWFSENGTIIITYDEGTGSTSGEESHIYTVVINSKHKGQTLSTHVNHYGLLATIEDLYKVPRLGSAAGAATLLPLIE